jgi:hypothetical protein
MEDAVIDVASLTDQTSDQASTDTQTQDTQVSDSTQTQDSATGNQDGQQQQATQTENLTGKAIRDAVRELSATSPAHAKILKAMADSHFRESQGWKAAFDTPQKASEAKSIIESAGGIEGIAAQAERIATYDQQDAALKDGNPEVLDAMFKDFPEGAAALAPHYLDRLQKANPDAYNAAIGPHAVQMLVQANVGSHLEAILAEKDPARAMAMVNQLNDWFKGQKQNAAQFQAGNGQRKNPEADKIAKDREALNTEKEKIFQDAVSGKVNAAVAAPLASVVDQYSKQYKLNETQKAHYQKTLADAVIAEMNGDKTYLKQVELRKGSKDRTHDSISAYISGEFNRRAKDKAFEVAKSIYGSPRAGSVAQNGTGVIKAGEPKTAPGGGPLLISAKPPMNLIDTNRPDADLLMIRGQAYLKDGRLVTWRKAIA